MASVKSILPLTRHCLSVVSPVVKRATKRDEMMEMIVRAKYEQTGKTRRRAGCNVSQRVGVPIDDWFMLLIRFRYVERT